MEQAKIIKEYLRLDPTINPDAMVVDLNKTEIVESKKHGEVAFSYTLLKELRLNAIINQSISAKENKHHYSSWIEIMIINRLCDPLSKYALVDWVPRTTLLYILGIQRKLYDNLFYRAMTKLWSAKDAIELKVWREITSKITKNALPTFYKDLTTTYYTGECCPIADYGHSKGYIQGCKQIKWGLIVTEEGLPVTLEVYRGNTSEKRTLIETIKRLKTVFGLQKGIVIGDRGPVSEKNCKEITSEGYEYIFTESNKNVEELIEEALEKGFQKIEIPYETIEKERSWFYQESDEKEKYIEIYETEKNGERWLVTRSEYKKFIDKERQNRILEKAEFVLKWARGEPLPIKKKKEWKKQTLDLWRDEEIEEIETLKKELKESRPPKDGQELIKSIAKKMAEFKGDKYYDYRYDEEKGLIITKLEDKIEKEKRYFGIWVLRTTTKKKSTEVIDIYRGMEVIEQGFRVIKSVLRVEPLNHRKPPRIESHLFICVLAYLVEKIIEMRLKEEGINLTARKAIDKFEDIIATKEVYPILKKEVWKIKRVDMEQEKIMNATITDDYYIKTGWPRL